MRRVLVCLLPMVLHASLAGSTPVLLASNSIGLGGGSSSVTDPNRMTAFAIEMGFTAPLGGQACSQPAIGCAPIPTAQLTPGSVFDYDSDNSPFFAEASSHWTNGIDELVTLRVRAFQDTTFLGVAGGGGSSESCCWGLAPAIDLQGRTIRFYRLRVIDFRVGSGCCGYAEFNSMLEWQVWGDDLPTPTLVSNASVSLHDGHALLEWRLHDAGIRVSIDRSVGTEPWHTQATLGTSDGVVRYRDDSLVPGARHRYALTIEGYANRMGELETFVPGPSALRIENVKVRSHGGIDLEIGLASEAPARLDIIDVTGRRAISRSLAGIEAGSHRIALEDGDLASGVYWVVLGQQGHRTSARFAVTR